MRRYPTPDLRLLAYNHALQHHRIPEPELARDGRVERREGGGAEGRGELVQIVADLIDRALFGLRELRRGGRGGEGEGGFFEEKADFVARGQEVGVSDVGAGFAGGEGGEGMGGEGEGG